MGLNQIERPLQPRDEPGRVPLEQRQHGRTIRDDEERIELIYLLGQPDRPLLVHFPLVERAELGQAPGHPRQRGYPIRSRRLHRTLPELIPIQRSNRSKQAIRRLAVLAETSARKGYADVAEQLELGVAEGFGGGGNALACFDRLQVLAVVKVEVREAVGGKGVSTPIAEALGQRLGLAQQLRDPLVLAEQSERAPQPEADVDRLLGSLTGGGYVPQGRERLVQVDRRRAVRRPHPGAIPGLVAVVDGRRPLLRTQGMV